MSASAPSQAARCLLCGSVLTMLVAVHDGFRIVRCGRCELVFVDTWHEIAPPEDLYGPRYFRTEGASPLGYQDYLAHERLHRRNARPILRMLERVTVGRRLVDVGGAHGFFLAAARERGWVGCGVDISAAAVRYAQEKLGLDVVHGDLAYANFAAGTFDVAAMIGTIEHMPDPLTTLRSAARLLKPDAHLLITTLDIEGVFRQWEWKPPEHIFYFSFRSLSRVLEAAGFQVLSRRCYWAWYGAGDLVARLLRHWGLPGARLVTGASERAGLVGLALRIPTNEMLVLARKR